MASSQNEKSPDIIKLISDLSSDKREVRENARLSLVAIGHPAIIPLLQQFHNSDKWARWESAKTLAEMREPSAAPKLVESLTHDDPNIRWLAAEGLIALGSISLNPILEALTHFSGNRFLAEGAHHVLSDLSTGRVHEGEYEYESIYPLADKVKSIIKPVLESLRTTGTTILTPEYAKVALSEIQRLENNSEKDLS